MSNLQLLHRTRHDDGKHFEQKLNCTQNLFFLFFFFYSCLAAAVSLCSRCFSLPLSDLPVHSYNALHAHTHTDIHHSQPSCENPHKCKDGSIPHSLLRERKTPRLICSFMALCLIRPNAVLQIICCLCSSSFFLKWHLYL